MRAGFPSPPGARFSGSIPGRSVGGKPFRDRSTLPRQSQLRHSVDRSAMLLKNTGLDRRLIQALAEAGITDTKQLQAMSDRELIRLPGIADRSVEIIRAYLQAAASR
jgi:DNA-directed RNA polymerase alpha subunit